MERRGGPTAVNGKTAFMFPGQGAQYVGMGAQMAELYPQVREALRQADAYLGEPLSHLCFHGPEDQLRLTVNTQPAILAVSVALLRLVSEVCAADYVVGHSLGEYAALVAAEALDFGDALKTVRLRGQLMESAVPANTGGMAAIIGLDAEIVAKLCSQAAQYGVVEIATLNGSKQIVIAGSIDAVNAAAALAKEAGARAVRLLNVSGPFHSSLLRGAGEKLGAALSRISMHRARIPVVCNTLATPQTDPDVLRRALIDQVSSTVRWEECIENMWQAGVRTFIEIGPGKVLAGLVSRMYKDALVFSIDTPPTWDKFIAWLRGNGVI
jgi:[acyl-carrier-protein] S-malonyltransferase